MDRTRPFYLLLAVLVGAGWTVDRARAQEMPPAAGAREEQCPDGRISEIFVDNKSVFDVGSPDLDARFNWAYRAANRLHVRTREAVIRRELLFRAGDCHLPSRLEDSERILRTLPFLAHAEVFAVRQPDSTYHAVVTTRDEWSTRLEPRVDSGALTGLELREDNLFGSGYTAAAFFRDHQGERIYGATLGSRQLFGTMLDAEVAVGRTPVGHAVAQRIAYPFRGESGRWAFRQQMEFAERNFEFFVPEEGREGHLERRFFPEERRSFDVGGVLRVGKPGNLTLFGLALAGERLEYEEGFLTPGEEGRASERGVTEPPRAVVGLDTISSLRVVFLAGKRNVVFDRRRMLDAVHGAEDVRLGTEVEAAIGRSLGAFSSDDDLALSFGLSAAGDLPLGVLAGFSTLLEGRRDFAADADTPEWRNLMAQLDGWAYWRSSPGSRHTWVAAVSAAGGWRTTVPFQLTLGSRSGVRGFERHAFAGDRRMVATLEHRAYLGWPFARLFDLGAVGFVDAGRIWTAAPDRFGADSPLAVSIGAGLRAAFPPESRRTYRLDIAVPVAGGGSLSDVVVSIGIGQAVGRSATGDDTQLRRSSRRLLSASLFNFPD